MMSLSTVQVRRNPIVDSRQGIDLSSYIIVLVGMVFISALGLIYLKYESQQLYIAYNNLKVEESSMMQEQDKLSLEQATLASLSRVYVYAREARMNIPAGKNLVVLR